MMAKAKKCDNPTCDCVPSDGSKYCSAYCEGAEDQISVVCHCGHTGCAGDVSEVKSTQSDARAL